MKNRQQVVQTKKNFLKFISFKVLEKWYVSYYLNPHRISSSYDLILLKNLIFPIKRKIKKNEYDGILPVVKKISFNDGKIHLRDKNKTAMDLYLLKKGELLVSKINFHQGAVALNYLNELVSSTHYQPYEIRKELIIPEYLVLILRSKIFQQFVSAIKAEGIKNEATYDFIGNMPIPLPSKIVQKKLLNDYKKKIMLANKQHLKANKIGLEIEEYLFNELGIKIIQPNRNKKKIIFANFMDLPAWGVDRIFNYKHFSSNIYSLISLEEHPELYWDIFRGKSPIYDKNSDVKILNQKCIRWNEINIAFGKTVDKCWINNVQKVYLTKINDILINSTGEGTIGRSVLITNKFQNYLYDSHILLFRPNLEEVFPLFFVYLFNSPFIQSQINTIKSAQSTNQTELGIENLKKLLIPLPELKTQKRIANHIQEIRKKNVKFLEMAESNHHKSLVEFEKEVFIV